MLIGRKSLSLIWGTLLCCLNAQLISVAPPTNVTNELVYHITFPYSDPQSVDTIPLDSDYTDLVQMNFVAGVLYGHMVNTTYPDIKFDKDYLYGSLFAQLLQENPDLATYPKAKVNDNINTEPEFSILLEPGQGGPYQINNYAIRLPDSTGKGLINYCALQNGLGYFIANQAAGFPAPFTQNTDKGPASLGSLFFGPIAAAYFQYNDLVATFTANSVAWGPEQATWKPCVQNLSAETGALLLLDMLQNANYNAGLYSSIFKQYVAICADPASHQEALDNIDNYALNDQQYNQTVGVDSSGTFILYPRQVRFYLDELFGNNSRIDTWLSVNNTLTFTFGSLKPVFESAMEKLGYGTSPANYALITQAQASTAFDSAMSSEGVTEATSVTMQSCSDREKLYAVLDQAYSNLESTLNFKFSDTTETDLWKQYAISNLQVVPNETDAVITWKVNAYNGAPLPTDGGVILGQAGGSPIVATNTAPGAFTATITNLKANTTYNFIVFNKDGSGYIAEELSSFKTGESYLIWDRHDLKYKKDRHY